MESQKKGSRSQAEMIYSQLEEQIIVLAVKTKSFTDVVLKMVYNDCILERQVISQLITVGYIDPSYFALT